MAATSGLTASTSSAASSDLARQSLLYPISTIDHGKSLGSMNMDDLLQNIYAGSPVAGDMSSYGGGVEGADQKSAVEGRKTVDEVWREISGDRKMGGGSMGLPEMTLEDYIARAGVVREEEIVVKQQMEGSGMGMVVDSALGERFGRQQQRAVEGSILGFGNGMEGGGRGRRRMGQDQADKIAQQRQRRMIKNRESAARSRERKQAYTVELESLVAQLEEQNSRLKQEQVHG